MDYNINKKRMQPTKTSGPSVATLSGQPGQVSSGMVKRSLAMDVPATYDALGSRILKQNAIAGTTCRCEIYLK